MYIGPSYKLGRFINQMYAFPAIGCGTVIKHDSSHAERLQVIYLYATQITHKLCCTSYEVVLCLYLSTTKPYIPLILSRPSMITHSDPKCDSVVVIVPKSDNPKTNMASPELGECGVNASDHPTLVGANHEPYI